MMSKFAHYRGGGRGRGGGNNFDGTIRASGTDRFCTGCGNNIKGFATIIPAKCPFTGCTEVFTFRYGPEGKEFDDAGWGRCFNCKSFIFRDHLHCSSCRHINPVAKEKKERLEKQALLKREFQLKMENEEKEKKIARLEAENLELNLIVGEQEARLQERRPLQGGVVPEDDGMDEVLSQIDVESGESSRKGDQRGNDGNDGENVVTDDK